MTSMQTSCTSPTTLDLDNRVFEHNAGKRAIPHEHLIELIESSSRRPRVQGLKAEEQKGLTRAEKAEYLVDELLQKRILVPLNPKRTAYAFPHRSFAEYLAACALATRSRQKEFWPYVDAKAWDPNWEQVVMFLAGRLSASPDMLRLLLQVLSEEAKDDMFRHRLAVAAQCLGEIPSDRRAAVSVAVDQITEAVFFFWWQHQKKGKNKGTDPPIPHVNHALRALGWVNGHVKKARLLVWVGNHLLQKHSGGVREKAAKAVGSLGSAAATSEILTRLAELLCDKREDVQDAAVEAFGALGPTAATPEILTRLAKFVQLDNRTGSKAVEAVGNIGSAAATPEILTGLVDQLDNRLSSAVAQAVRGLGAAAATPDFLDRLAKCLNREGILYPGEHMEVVRILGSAAATPNILEEMLRILGLHPPRPYVVDGRLRSDVVRAVGDLRPATEAPEFVGRLTALLSDEDPNVRFFSASALSHLGSPAGQPHTLTALVALLRDGYYVREAAEQAIRSFGPAAAPPEFLDQLMDLLDEDDNYVRRAAAETIAWLELAPPLQNCWVDSWNSSLTA